MKKLTRVLVLLMCFVLLAVIPVSAAGAPYVTYQYTIDGDFRAGPHAYSPSASYTFYEMNMATPLNAPQDIFVDEKGNGNIYISDTKNNRVVVCNSDFIYQFEISGFINEHGVPDSLLEPTGLFVLSDKGPAIPVMPIPISVPIAFLTPVAICRATCSLTAPNS